VIPAAYITEWRSHAPWTQNAWVEQDLIISRALVDIFGAEGLADSLSLHSAAAPRSTSILEFCHVLRANEGGSALLSSR
jgi:hypothetical protein